MTRIVTRLASLALAVLARTWRVSVSGAEHPTGLRRSNRPFIFALWHSHLLPLVWLHRGEGASLVVSAHRDGGYLAGAARRWGYGLIRGSSTRGGVAALRHMVRTLRAGGEIAVTPDGPRGPAHVVKPGAVAAAQISGAPIVSVAVGASGSWNLGSWDGFVVPWPFARVRVVYGDPLVVNSTSARSQAVRQLQERLNDVTKRARC